MVVLSSKGNLYHYVMDERNSQLNLIASYYREGDNEIKAAKNRGERVFEITNNEIGDISAMQLLEDTIIMTFWNSEECKCKYYNFP